MNVYFLVIKEVCVISIDNFKKKTITLDELKDLYKVYEHKEIVNIIDNLIKSNKIKNIKASDKTPNYPQIHKKYKILKQQENNSKELNELNNLYICFSIDFYKNNITLYKEHKKYIKQLSDYFFNKSELLKRKISVNERSYEIFVDEKFLCSNLGKEILRNLNIDISTNLNAYSTPEPFCSRLISFETPQKVLIVENKDTFITLIKIISNKHHQKILGESIKTIIYGEGYKIKSSFEYINEDTTLSYLNNPENEFLYWGDIDKEGFIIYEVLKKNYENFNIKLFDKAYLKMIEKSKFFNLTKIKNTQKQNYKNSLDELDFKLKEEICFVIDNGNYIPQEILNLFDLTSD